MLERIHDSFSLFGTLFLGSSERFDSVRLAAIDSQTSAAEPSAAGVSTQDESALSVLRHLRRRQFVDAEVSLSKLEQRVQDFAQSELHSRGLMIRAAFIATLYEQDSENWSRAVKLMKEAARLAADFQNSDYVYTALSFYVRLAAMQLEMIAPEAEVSILRAAIDKSAGLVGEGAKGKIMLGWLKQNQATLSYLAKDFKRSIALLHDALHEIDGLGLFSFQTELMLDAAIAYIADRRAERASVLLDQAIELETAHLKDRLRLARLYHCLGTAIHITSGAQVAFQARMKALELYESFLPYYAQAQLTLLNEVRHWQTIPSSASVIIEHKISGLQEMLRD